MKQIEHVQHTKSFYYFFFHADQPFMQRRNTEETMHNNLEKKFYYSTLSWYFDDVGFQAEVNSIKWDPTGLLLASGSDDTSARVSSCYQYHRCISFSLRGILNKCSHTVVYEFLLGDAVSPHLLTLADLFSVLVLVFQLSDFDIRCTDMEYEAGKVCSWVTGA